MPAFITFGRILFAVIFIASGAMKLLDLPKTADKVNTKVVMTLPSVVTPYKEQIETVTGMESKQLLAIVAGAVELICGILVALNVGARFFALVLVLFLMAATYYSHDFWNQSGPDATITLVEALKNLSLIGGLFIIAGIGRGPQLHNAYTDV